MQLSCKTTLTIFLLTASIFFEVSATHAYTLQSTDVIKIDPQIQRYDLSPYVEYLEDPTGSLDIKDVTSEKYANDFIPVKSNIFNPGLSSSTFWLHFKISNGSIDSRDEEWVINTGKVFLSYAKLYTRNLDGDNENWTTRKSGDRSSTDKIKPVFNIMIKRGDIIECYLQIRSSTSLFLPLKLSTEDNYVRKTISQFILFGIYYGIILALVIYNLFLYISLRDNSYLWYVTYIAMVAGYFIGVNGLTFQWGIFDSAYATAAIMNISLGIALICAAQFSRSFLMTKRNSKSADIILKVCIIFTFILTVSGMFINISLLNVLYTILGPVTGIAIISSGILCLRQRFKPAKFLLLAWIPYIIGALIYTSILKGHFPYSQVGYYSFQTGSAMEALLLSFALADRIRRMQKKQEESQARERLYMELASTDGLTGLFNADHFRKQISKFMQQSEQQDIPLSLLMIDIDDFKLLNDTYGHLAGDKILAIIGKEIQASVRSSDLPCRYGGEEFAILLPDSDLSQTIEVAERIRYTLDSRKHNPIHGESIDVTVSIGIACYINGDTAIDFISRADKMLYDAKKHGKNKVVYHNI